MELFLKDRLIMAKILPAENTLVDYAVKQQILSLINVEAAEMQNYSVQVDEVTGNMSWDGEYDKANPHIVEFDAAQKSYLMKVVSQLIETPQPDEYWPTIESLYNALK